MLRMKSANFSFSSLLSRSLFIQLISLLSVVKIVYSRIRAARGQHTKPIYYIKYNATKRVYYLKQKNQLSALFPHASGNNSGAAYMRGRIKFLAVAYLWVHY
jgi:hypothetical protein